MILVTGSSGFVGRHLLARLVAKGERVRCLAHRSPSGVGHENVEAVRGDVADLASLRSAMQGVDAVIHLVAIIRESKTASFSGVNLIGTRNVLTAAKEDGVRRVVHMGALGAGPDPRFPYTYSKWQAEEEVRQSGLDYRILEPSIIFGDGDEFVNMLANIVRQAPLVPIIGSGKTLFQPIWVEDVVACALKTLDDDSFVGRTVRIGGPEHLTYEQIVDIIIRTLGTRRMKAHIPVPLMKPIVRAMETLLPRPPVTSAQLAMLALDNVVELDSVQKHFGFAPASLREKIDYVKRPRRVAMSPGG